MRKFIILLLFPVIIIAQDLKLDHSYIDAAPFAVGDTITIKFNTIDINSTVPTLMVFDYQYNNKLLQKIGHTFKLPNNPSALKSLNHWDGYTWYPSGNIASNNLSSQYLQGTYMGNVAEWSVERITVQDGSPLIHGQTIVEVQFIVKDKANTSFSNYSQVTKLNWSYIKDNVTNTTYDVEGMTMAVDLGDVGGGVLNAVTLRLNTPLTNKSDFYYVISNLEDTEVASGNLDASGEATITGLLDGVEYKAYLGISPTSTSDGTPIYPDFLDNVVTVSDVYLVFNYMSNTDIDGNGTGTFDYFLQKLFANVSYPKDGTWDANVNDEDSYIFLAYLAGNLPDYNFADNSTFYPISSTKYGAMNYSMLASNYGAETLPSGFSNFTPFSSSTIFEFSHGFGGDVDLSHSTTPDLSGYNAGAGKSRLVKKEKDAGFQKISETANIDISTQLIDGKVVLQISTSKQGLSGAQINLKYDPNLLTFDQVSFDTGNAMTNFATEKSGKIFIGSLDLKGEETIKTGTPYRVTFTPKQPITNTSGLITFGVTEGVKTDGTKVNFNLQ